MRIAEISTPDLRHPSPSTQEHQLLHQPLISQLETLISLTETLSPNPSSLPETIPSDLRQTLAHLAQIAPFPKSLKLQIWKLSYRLWNACVDISNSINLRPLPPSSSVVFHHHAQLRHLASDMLFLASDVSGVPSREIKSASFYHRTGLIWHELRNFDIASTCFEKATDIVSKLDVAKISDSGERKLLLDINIARSRTAWEVSDRNLAVTLLNRSKTLLFGEADHYMKLANQFLSFSTVLLAKDEPNCHNEALKLMNEALDLSERGSSAARTREQMVELKKLSSKSLRFIAAVHLQKGEFESVIKCVKVLREGSSGTGDSGDSHGSLPVLAMKAWLGLGRYAEAEKELRGMVINKGIPENVWVSAVETYFESVGTAGAETAKGVFFGLLERCHVSAGAAIRVVSRVLQCGGGGAEGAKVRAKVVAELVSDKRVVALFEVETAAKARKALHAVLWNFAADNFRSKDYETSAEMFDKAMLYTPRGMEEKILRAKGFRVLCLCYLGLSQLDRAQEYINEAAKLDPNVACAFLKFKICLQKGDSSGAINQIQAMQTCLDFTPDFLSLSAHEAVASRAISVAVNSLSDLLNYYTSGRPMPTTEVVVLRSLITILTQDHVDETEVLKFMKRAHIRAIELGLECFYGKGEVGRREQNWFAVTAWNCGTKCGKEKKYELCAEFLRLVPEFCSCIINEQEENNVMVCSSLILTVAAMIASENQKKIPLLDSEVKLAVEMLDRAAKMLSSVSSGIITSAPELFFMYTVNAYDIHGRLHDLGRQQQLLLVRSFASSKASSPNFLLQIGITASQGPRSNPEVASFALNESLSALLSSPVPDYHNIALIVRRLIALASIHKGDSDNDVVYSMYKQAYRIMVGLKEGEYPSDEGKWLAMSAWNRSALPVRLGQVDDAKKWMDMGLQLSRKVSGMQTYRACMEDFASAFDKKFPSLKL